MHYDFHSVHQAKSKADLVLPKLFLMHYIQLMYTKVPLQFFAIK